MTANDAKDLTTKVDQLKALMSAYATDGRTNTQSYEYQVLYREIALDLEAKPTGTLGNLLKDAQPDKDVEHLLSQAYGYASNRDGVRHGGTRPSNLTKAEAEFFLNFAVASITYLVACKKQAA